MSNFFSNAAVNSDQKYNILVTGGAGAIGTNLVKTLLAQQHQVTVIDDLSSGFAQNIDPKTQFIKGDILNDDVLDNIFKQNIDYIFHLAALFANQNSVLHPQKDLNVNALGTLKILEKAHQYKVRKVLYVSSSCVYGNSDNMQEDEPLVRTLDTPYAISKLMGEHYCKFFSREHGLDTVIVRLFNSFGPYEKPGIFRNVIPNFIDLAMKQQSLTITGTGLETRDFTYVDDIVQGMNLALFKPTQAGDIFNLGSGQATSIQTLVESINAITGNKAPIIYKERRSWDTVLKRVARIEKSQKILGFNAKASLTEGLECTFRWLRENNRA